MKYATFTLLLLSSLILGACDEQPVKANSDTVTISKSEYEQLKADSALAKQIGRYKEVKLYGTTMRLDTATGQTCVLLTTRDQWKIPDIAAQSCRLVQ